MYKHYDYRAGESQAHGGLVTITMSGDFDAVSSEPALTIVGSPYCAVVHWESEDLSLEGKSIEIRILNLSQSSRLIIDLNKIDKGAIKVPNKRFYPDAEDGTYFKGAVCNLSIIEHETVTIEGVIIIEGESESYKATLSPHFWKERRNDTFDGIMSV